MQSCLTELIAGWQIGCVAEELVSSCRHVGHRVELNRAVLPGGPTLRSARRLVASLNLRAKVVAGSLLVKYKLDDRNVRVSYYPSDVCLELDGLRSWKKHWVPGLCQQDVHDDFHGYA